MKRKLAVYINDPTSPECLVSHDSLLLSSSDQSSLMGRGKHRSKYTTCPPPPALDKCTLRPEGGWTMENGWGQHTLWTRQSVMTHGPPKLCPSTETENLESSG